MKLSPAEFERNLSTVSVPLGRGKKSLMKSELLVGSLSAKSLLAIAASWLMIQDTNSKCSNPVDDTVCEQEVHL